MHFQYFFYMFYEHSRPAGRVSSCQHPPKQGIPSANFGGMGSKDTHAGGN